MKLKELLAQKQVFCPCIYDCASALAARDCGFEAVLLSGGGLAYSRLGLPDLAMLTADDLVRTAERVAACTDLPLVVDADDGYGESPAVVYRTAKRLAEAGAQALTIEDSTGIRGFERYIYAESRPEYGAYVHRAVGRELWLSKIAAAAEACRGTDCFVIARTECFSALGHDEMLERIVRSRRAGAEMTLVCDGMETPEEAARVAAADPGWKMWPDYYSIGGEPAVPAGRLAELGFNLVTMHIFEKAALYGMLSGAKAAADFLGR